MSIGSEPAIAPSIPKKKLFRKDKPWDTDDIDHWKIEPFLPEHSSGHVLEESSFVILFPKYRETYLREIWPQLTKILDGVGVACLLDLIQGSMSVKTTRKMHDPYIIIKARDVLKLLARSVPLPAAIRVMEDGITMDIIKIGNILRNKQRFVKRRMRLVGSNGTTLKGNTVSVIGDIKGLKEVRRIVLDCMKNIHPIHHIKVLMIKKELAKDERLKTENWDRFLPKYKKKVQSAKTSTSHDMLASSTENSTLDQVSKDLAKCESSLSTVTKKHNDGEKDQKKRESKRVKKEKEYTPFPPPQLPRKEDLLLESGEYFLKAKDKQKNRKYKQSKSELSLKKAAEKDLKKKQKFIPPKEKPYVPV